MKFSVATNFQDDLIQKINKKEVFEIYGKLTADFIGGGRASVLLPFVDKERVRKHVKQAHNNGLEFNYLLNSICLGNKEHTIPGQKKIYSLLDWIESIGVDSVTVATPYLLQLIKKQCPQLKVKISVGAQTDNMWRAKYWEEQGADSITLAAYISRKFDLLAKIRKNIKCKLQLITNNSCLYNCPFSFLHQTVPAHASQADDDSRGCVIDYYSLNCKYLRLLDTTNFIRSSWIRPEDVHFYGDIGINSLKLIDRSASTDTICLIVDAYTNRRYNGNLIDLFPTLSGKNFYSVPSRLLRGIKYFFHPLKINLFLVYRISNLLSELKVYIENQALDGFLEYFVKGNCKDGLCEECGYCRRWAERVVKVDEDYRNKMLLKYKDILDELISKRITKFI